MSAANDPAIRPIPIHALSASALPRYDDALTAFTAGRLPEARVACLRRCAVDAPSPQDWQLLGAVEGSLGNLAQAEDCFRRVIAVQPGHERAWGNLARTLLAQERLQEASDAYRSYLRLAPGDDAAWITLSGLLAEQGLSGEAIDCARQALAIQPQARGHFHLAGLLHDQGDLEAAGAHYRQALALDPGSAEGHNTLGNLLVQAQRPAEAEACYREALKLRAGFPEAWLNLAFVLLTAGRRAEALVACERALALRAGYPDALDTQAHLLALSGRFPEALPPLRRALALAPSGERHLALARCLVQGGQYAEALDSADQALALEPRSAEAHFQRASCLRKLARLSEALDACRKALRLAPGQVETLRLHGRLLIEIGRLDEGMARYEEALRLRPDHEALQSACLFFCNDSAAYTPGEVCARHRAWGETWGATLPDLGPVPVQPLTGRRLRIAYLSPDLRHHSVPFFLEPVLAHHDHDRFEVFAFAEVAREDDVSARLKGHCDHWFSTVGRSDLEVARSLRAQGIDIVIELAGHTTRSRLRALRYRPAPVQVSYLGYLSTTGLPAMDYRLTDVHADPPGRTEGFYTERLARLPVHYCYLPPSPCPDVPPLPAAGRGGVTFLSTNNLAKLTDPVIALWARVLHAVPGARLRLKGSGLNEAGVQDYFAGRFARCGIGPERLWMEGKSGFNDYLRTLADSDIALDPFPFNGGTTSYHCLWMGLPVVTLEGASYASRMGTAILSTLGLPELIARSEDEYVALCASLAEDRARLAGLRAGLRPRMQDSPLTDGPGYTRHFERALLDLWRECAGDADVRRSGRHRS